MASFSDLGRAQRVALVVGASRGIGRQIAIDLAKDGYTVAVAAKTVSQSIASDPFPPDPNSQASTITTVQREIEQNGGRAVAIQVDVRDTGSIEHMVDSVIKACGRLDVLVYNSGAIWWSSVKGTPLKRFQLMQRINPEGLYTTIQACLPHFERSGWHGRIVVISPPIYSRFARGKTAYAMGKFAMSTLTIGLAMDFERQGLNDMAITSLWPAAAIESAATADTKGEARKDLRKATIFSDAVLAIMDAPPAEVNGKLEVDEDLLRRLKGMTDFSKYSTIPGTTPRRIMPASFPSLRVAEQDDEGQRRDSNVLRAKL